MSIYVARRGKFCGHDTVNKGKSSAVKLQGITVEERGKSKSVKEEKRTGSGLLIMWMMKTGASREWSVRDDERNPAFSRCFRVTYEDMFEEPEENK